MLDVGPDQVISNPTIATRFPSLMLDQIRSFAIVLSPLGIL